MRRSFYRCWLLVLMVLTGLEVSAQSEKTTLPKFGDDPAARLEFELLKTRDPATGKIPGNIRALELEFAKSKQSGVFLPFAAGDIESAWINRGPNNVGGRTRALAVDADDSDRILAGGVSGGMWVSPDQGSNWSKTTGSNDLQSVTCIAQDLNSTDNDTWYYGTGEFRGNSASGEEAFYHGEGIYKSTDNGASWSILPATTSGEIHLFDDDFDLNHELVVDPTDGDLLVANVGGIYRSTNGGNSFSQVLSQSGGLWSDIVVTSTGIFYAHVERRGIFRSTDGSSWTDITPTGMPLANNDRMELAIAPSDEDILYALGEDSNAGSDQHTLWRYNDNNGNWSDRSANLPAFGEDPGTGNFNSQGGYDLLVKVHPSDRNFVVIGGRNLWRSTDGFNSALSKDAAWIGGYTPQNNSFALYEDQHPDQHAFVFLASDEAISANDGGLQFTSDITDEVITGGSDNGAVDWTPLNNGYLTTQVYALSYGPGDQLMAGFQDNGTWVTNSASATSDWTEAFSGDGAYNDWSDDGTSRYVSAQNGQVFRLTYSDADDLSSNGFAEISPSDYNSSLFIAPFYLDPGDDELFYLGGDNELFANDQASTASTSSGWRSISLPGSSGSISELGPTGSGPVYVGTSTGDLFLVSNIFTSNPVVENITDSEFPEGYISGIGVNPFRPNEALVVFSNYSVKSVFHTDDNGASWTDVSGDLEENADGSGNGPSIRTVRILGDGDRYFVGSSTGLYSTTTLDGTSTVWAQEDATGIGNVVVEHLVVRESDGLIAAGTHGNGIFSADFEVSGPLTDDLAIKSITSPTDGLLTDAENVNVIIRNQGVNTQSDFTVSLFVNEVLIVEDELSSSLMQDEELEYTFSSTVDLSSPDSYDIRVEHDLVDENSFNNSLTLTVQSVEIIADFPYSEGFENSDHGWTGEFPWELGEPSDDLLSEASEGTQAWVTDLDGNYPNNITAHLISPVFDFSDLVEPGVSFDINYSIETGFDGVVIAFRTDLEDDFTTVPSSSGGANWYDENTAAFGSTPAWTGVTSGYVRAMGELKDLAGEETVQLAFIFASDEFLVSEGFAMDDFLISDDYVPNIVPSFTAGPDVEVEANSGSQTIQEWATEISDGNEETQELTFDLTSDNTSLFSAQPSITLEGDLSFTPIANTIGVANITATLTDDGGTPTDDTDDLSFSEDFTITVTPIVAIEPELTERRVSIYPNPADERVNIDFEGLSDDARIRLYNLSGVTLLEKAVKANAGSVTLDLSDVPNGIYFLDLEDGSERTISRIVKN